MTQDRNRVVFVCSHPVQYMAQVFRGMAQHPKLDIMVAYCSLQGADRGVDPEFGIELAWDVPLLDGYPWVLIQNRSLRPGLGRFWGLLNPGLWKLVRAGEFDAVVIFTGYLYATFWIGAAAAKRNRKALLFASDAHELRSRGQQAWKARFKKWFWPRLFRLADIVIVPSSRSVQLMCSLGIPPERVVLTPYVVHNNWWLERAGEVDRAAVRRHWSVPECAPAVLFCAKLQPWKRPQDLLRAFARANVPDAYLVYAGEGPMRPELQAEAATLGVADRVRFLGFANQSQLPAVYRASDLLVLPSEYEPFGVVVNEAMLCGCAVAVSDRVGAGYDLVRPGETGFIFPCGDTDALAQIFREALPAPERLQQIGAAARRRLESWSPRENIEAMVQAIERAKQFAQDTRRL